MFSGVLDEVTLTWMRKPRCGLPDRIIPVGSSTRRKRNINIEGNDISLRSFELFEVSFFFLFY